MRIVNFLLHLVPSSEVRRVVHALAIGTITAATVVALVLVAGYGRGRTLEALYVTGVAAALLVLPIVLSSLVRAFTLRWSARFNNAEAMLWLLASLATWWCLPVFILPSGGPGVFGLMLAAIPLSIQVMTTALWLACKSDLRLEERRTSTSR